MQAPLLVDPRFAEELKATARAVHLTGGMICDTCERLVLRPSNGVVEASDYLSNRHDWVQLQEEVTAPLQRVMYVPPPSLSPMRERSPQRCPARSTSSPARDTCAPMTDTSVPSSPRRGGMPAL